MDETAGTAPPAVVAVVLNWNGADDTIACLESLARSGTAGLEAVVVDNGSREEDVGRVERAIDGLGRVSLVRNRENLGFAGGCNVGIEWALERGAGLVFLLNNDATVEPGAIDALVDYMRATPGAGAVSPLILDATGERIWAAGGVRSRGAVVCDIWLAKKPPERAPREPFEPYALIGCAMLVRREVFERVGMMDPEFFAYVEDVDFSLRVRAAGWALAVVPVARVRHAVSRSTGGGYSPMRNYLLARGTALFLRRQGALDQRLGFAIVAPLKLVAAGLREWPRGNLRAVLAKFHGYLDGLRLRPPDRRFFRDP